MALKPSSLSVACSAVRSFLVANLEGAGVGGDIDIQVGSPVREFPSDGNIVNLFFYRFEPAGFGPLPVPNQPWRMRLYCLISAFGAPLDNVSSGENELRVLGEVMRLFHENPVLASTEILVGDQVAGEGENFRMDAVYSPLTEEQLGQFWGAVQGGEERRVSPSIAYEFSLAPVVPEQRGLPQPAVGAIGFEARADFARQHDPPTATPLGPIVPRSEIDLANPAWEPRLCWIIGGECQLTHALAASGAGSFTPRLWLTGDSSASVELIWELWTATSGWTESADAPTAATPHGVLLDPDSVPATDPGTFPIEVGFPSEFDSSVTSQLMLHARRTYTPLGGDPITVRSNPILLSVYLDS